MDSSEQTDTKPGIHPHFEMWHFKPEEQDILRKLSHEWYLTRSGKEIRLLSSRYRYFLMKPTRLFREMFNIQREVLGVFSEYEKFQPRCLDAFEAAQSLIPSDYRLETACKVLISQDSAIESSISDIIKSNPEFPIVVPFNYSELLTYSNPYFLRNRFQSHMYTRDLFAFQSPLKKDLYFFGRSGLVLELVNKHRSGEHVGLFGLRKCGKTSIIYAIERLMQAHSEDTLSFDCEDPSIHKLRWNELLFRIASDYQEKKRCGKQKPNPERYREKEASQSFQEDMLGYYSFKHRKPVLLIFDEIERIAPRTGTSPHWRDDEDFVLFWQSMRAFYQKYPHVLTYMLVGTNPSCVELSVINNVDNPIFASIPTIYVPPFSAEQVREMVRKLGRYMGLKFDEAIYYKLCEDFGGHPFLIRQVGSDINKLVVGQKPAVVDYSVYDRAKEDFAVSSSDYLQMITLVLREFYPIEYEMLCCLAQDDRDTFNEMAADCPEMVKHLVGYGLVKKGALGYQFSISAIKKYLLAIQKYASLNLSEEGMVAEVSERRNRLERRLRAQIKSGFVFKYGRKEGFNKALYCIEQKRRDKLAGLDIDELFSKDHSPLFFSDLINMLNREWDVFSPTFETEKQRLQIMLEDINTSGRPDAHAKSIDKDTFTQLRMHFKKLEGIMSRW